MLKPVLSPEEKIVVEQFNKRHVRDKEGRFIVPLPRKANVTQLDDSRTQALRKFRSMEQSLRAKGTFEDFAEVMREYFKMGQAEQVPLEEVNSLRTEVYYLPMRAIQKEDGTTSKLRIVFDA